LKIVLISPFFDKKFRKTTRKTFRFPPLNLPIVASLTPKEFEVKIIDESVENINFDEEADLVGITCMTAQAPRAYSVADAFRKRGTKVVLGGIHPTALPNEAAKHADAIVLGEAENTWEELIFDLRKNGLKKFYSSIERPSLKNLPLPRLDLLKRDRYIFGDVIQIFRGCPFACSFCSVSNFFGNTYRYRPVDDVVNEVKFRRSNTARPQFMGFLDDNVAGLPHYAKELFRKLIPLNIWWAGQASLTVAKDKELLKILRRSGCKFLYIGFESISQAALREANKNFLKVSKFKEAVKRIHGTGINIEGAFIFGFDDDDETIFERTVKFADKIGVDAAQFGILTPFPGTKLWDKLEKENRIFTKDWTKYGVGNAVFKPQKMSPEKLKEGTEWAWKEFYSLRNIGRRFGRALSGRTLAATPMLALQLAYKSTMAQRRKIDSEKDLIFTET
jgi:radical SAM superfamily enzyme YgiQ (UPF0313 family)